MAKHIAVFHRLGLVPASEASIIIAVSSAHRAASLEAVITLKAKVPGFPGGAVVGSLPANAGGAGSSPGLGRSHMPQSGWARGPQLLSLRVWSCAPQREGPRW